MEKFDSLGTLHEWLGKEFTPNYSLRIINEDLNSLNIPIIISTEEEVVIRILCTKDLSDSIRKGERTINELNENIVYKVLPKNGKPFYRLSTVIFNSLI